MALELPGGTVTFVFTDVEGSTRLVDELGPERYGAALAGHQDVVRAALEEHGGVEVDTQGDAFFCAFGSARAAVACAAAIQAKLEAGPVRIRIGVHTGEALVVDRRYVGLDVHRAARIGASGHGGQVVISPTTVALLEPGEVPLRNLGAHRLKDLSAPVVLHQLGDADFPPLATLFRTNLPVPATSFLGRTAELAELVERAAEADVRALTLTGPGGTGKTRLALQLAGELADGYPDGAWWVPLASLRDASLVASAVAGVLDVEEEAGVPLASSIASSLAKRRALLLLDNCEHVIDAVAELAAALLGAGTATFLLATSREPLSVAGEHVYPVAPLGERDAVELFHARARAAGARLDPAETHDVVAELCARLDNLPLAVELAAARSAALPPATLLERLATRLDVLSGPRGAEERQRTLRAAIAWSYDLLAEHERRLFRRLGVFVGGASLRAIEDVCDAELEDVLSLVSKSLVRQGASGDEPRYWMLETLHEFAAEELEASCELDSLRARHLDWFATLAREARDGLESLASGEHLTRLELDLANLRSAFEWAEQHECAAETVALARALWSRHFLRGRYAEAEDAVRRALTATREPLDVGLLHDRLGVVLRLQGRPHDALEAYRASEQAFGNVADRDPAWWEGWLDLRLDEAHLFYFQNERAALEEVIGELEESMPEHGTPSQRGELRHVRLQYRYRVERYAPSRETEELAREIHAFGLGVGDPSADFSLGFCLLWRGELAEAEEYLERGREVARARGASLLEARSLVYGLLAKRKRGDLEAARTRLAELEALDELHGYGGLVHANAAWIAWRDGDLHATIRRGSDALAAWAAPDGAHTSVFQWTARFPLLGAELARGGVDAAGEHARAMIDPGQQPLPDEVAVALEHALRDASHFERVLELARPGGYA